MNQTEHLQKILKVLYTKSPHRFCMDMWDTCDQSTLVDHWLLHYYADTFMWHTRHFLPDLTTRDWVDDRKYQKIIDNLKKQYPRHRIVDLRNKRQHLTINIPPRHSKLLSDDTPVFTTNGWTTHGQLKVGDYVYNHEGKAVQVTHVHPKDFADKEVVFINGDSIKCNKEHLWMVHYKNKKAEIKNVNFIQSFPLSETRGKSVEYNFYLPETRDIIDAQGTITYRGLPRIAITEIRDIEPVQGNCITVEGGMYLAGRSMLPTHNSMYLNVELPTWLATVARLQVASVSHVAHLSGSMNTKRQRILNSDKYKNVFGQVKLIENTKTKLLLDTGSEMYSVPLGTMTGFGGDVIVLDDLINAEDAGKQQESFKTAMAFLQHTLPSRLNNPQTTGVIINIQQRLATNDPTGFFIDTQKDNFNFVSIPAIMQEDIIYVSPTSGEAKIFYRGDSLWPERFGDYSNLRRSIGNEAVFRAQYLQEPSKESTYLKEDDFLYLNEFEAADILEDPEFIFASHDFPIKDKESSDLLGSVLAYYKDNKLLIVDCFEQRMAYNASEAWVKNLSDNTPMLTQIVESKANGEIIIQRLQGIIPGLIAYDPKSNSKGQRLEIAVSRMVSRNVYFMLNKVNELPERLKMLKDRLLSFPMVANDDIVDAFSQLVIHAFEEKQFSIFSSSISKYNVLARKPLTSRVDAAITREGQLYKFLKFTYDNSSDSLWILEEDTFYATEFDALARIQQLQIDVRTIIDATDEQVIYSAFMGKVRGMINYTDGRKLSQKMMQIQIGIGACNIKWDPNCVEFKRDLAVCAYDKNALKDGVERLATREGFVACLRAAIYFYKGAGEFRINERNRI